MRLCFFLFFSIHYFCKKIPNTSNSATLFEQKNCQNICKKYFSKRNKINITIYLIFFYFIKSPDFSLLEKSRLLCLYFKTFFSVGSQLNSYSPIFFESPPPIFVDFRFSFSDLLVISSSLEVRLLL